MTKSMTLESRWIILGADGRSVTLGRHTDPSEDEITAAERALVASGQAGWLAVLRGTYYSRRSVELLMVRPLGEPEETWDVAVSAFKVIRDAATRPS